MKDSKGNFFSVDDTLVSSQCPDTDSGIFCKSITGNVASFEHQINYFPALPFCLNQNSLDISKWVVKKGK